MIEFDPDVRGGEGFPIARDILDSGRALAKMNAIIDAQGRPPFECDRRAGAALFEIAPAAERHRHGIDNLQLARIARLAGAPKVRGRGRRPVRKLGDAVRARRSAVPRLCGLPADLAFAREWRRHGSGYTIGERAATRPREFAPV